jgi:putative component of membrane protein insertase Oxa1/YidC/SpoIIIJ protein YidD
MHMPDTSHPSWFHHPNTISCSVQVMKLFIMQCSPASCHFLPLRSKYSSQHPILEHIYILPLIHETKFQTHKK